MYKVYQLQIKDSHIENHVIKSCRLEMNVIGEYLTTASNNKPLLIAGEVWHACNILCWNRDNYLEDGDMIETDSITFYPNSNFIGTCGSDIAVETDDGLYVAESFGWKKVKDIEEATYNILGRRYYNNLDIIANKDDFDLSKIKRI